jgi:hypothetical protein
VAIEEWVVEVIDSLSDQELSDQIIELDSVIPTGMPAGPTAGSLW